MQLLIDTQILLWLVNDSTRLKPSTRALLDSADAIYVSVASLWECEMKRGIGKLAIELGELIQSVQSLEFEIIHIRPEHIQKVALLPMVHKDPFDRLLLTQTADLGLTLLTADATLKDYPGRIIGL